MAETKITYGSDVALAVTEWDTTLATTQFATSAIFDNTTSLFMDVLVGGVLELDATTPVAGDTMDIYVLGQYSGTATDMTGAIDALLNAATEEAEDTAFVKANLILLVSISVEADTPATAQGYHWGPIGIAQYFGQMPQRFMLLLHNNPAGTMAANPDVNTVGVTYTST